jgi:hypothetical protein
MSGRGETESTTTEQDARCQRRSAQLRVSYVLTFLALAVSLSACGPADNPRKRAPGTLPPISTRNETPIMPGIRFDPERLRRGMRVGDLVVDTVDARQATIDSAGATGMIPTLVWVGTARFHGPLTLRGRLMKHFDPDVRWPCFEADSASAALMPRWAGDIRRQWFCFPDAEAERLVGKRSLHTRYGYPDEGWPLEVVIDGLAIRRSFSDDVNTAHLVRIRDLARCYRSPHSVLLGPATKTGQQGHPPGWVRLDGFPEGDQGEAELRDSDGNGSRAVWRRQSGDSLVVIVFNDFERIEIRFLVSKGDLTGHATAHSDAALEPDSTGALSDLRRSWKFSAIEAPCDSMY